MKLPQQNGIFPTRGNALSRGLGIFILKLMGWTIEGELPKTKKCLLILAPHTSNWDFVIAMGSILAAGVKVSWMGKDSIFIWPVKYLWFWLGGIPTVRNKDLGTVEQKIEVINTQEKIVLAIAPEGTRSSVDKWKTGFYHMAHGANIPIFPVALNYATKTVELNPLFETTGNIESDIKAIQSTYQRGTAKYPENAPWISDKE